MKKEERQYPRVMISPKAKRSIQNGHPWIYGEEILDIEGVPQNGELVDVFAKNSFMGTGFYNSTSKITVRLISRNANDVFDNHFWRRRIEYAIRYRKTVMPGADFACCRLIHGEADQMPGLTVDRYDNILSVQITCLGMELIKDTVYRALWDVLTEMDETITGIYEHNDISLRSKEGLREYKGWYRFDGIPVPESAVTEICENGVRYLVDVENGQKTGFFLDQKYNRAAVARVANGKRVLDCFTHTGSFGLNAALGGAERVTCVDISQSAINMAKANAIRNNLDGKMDFLCEDMFDLLTRLADQKCRNYDFIILDPPAFTKSRKTVEAATRGYKEINFKAMKLLPRGGYLATCSCSHFVTDDLFRKILASAAKDAAVSLRQIEARQQAPDHPILWNVPETDYLKFYIFQVV
ncbi:class I SAM-dependent rRNA methyltransferase [Tepidimicrobium xylanilyticum]|uniref:SAM-dependent methyltransferase n=1 Tax=Tepidimicrobium xylanilyticum TaxID=1123352 RepID=A0A1H3EE76_9FIRM|nr:class I SAM-dependent rRNA methyltransferase [Tepidimicrobium xylanilyticum]SDX76935.1 SAM-dependent methyltransferase [Tepidimicrobium xylanilyticum]